MLVWMADALFVFFLLAVVVSVVGIGVLCALVSPWFFSLAVVEAAALGWANRNMLMG